MKIEIKGQTKGNRKRSIRPGDIYFRPDSCRQDPCLVIDITRVSPGTIGMAQKGEGFLTVYLDSGIIGFVERSDEVGPDSEKPLLKPEHDVLKLEVTEEL